MAERGNNKSERKRAAWQRGETRTQDTASLLNIEARLGASDALLEDRRNLGCGGLSGVAAGQGGGGRDGGAESRGRGGAKSNAGHSAGGEASKTSVAGKHVG